MEDIGMELKVRRIRRRITQTDLAKKLGVSQVRVSNIERSSKLQPNTVERYENALREIDAGTDNEATR